MTFLSTQTFDADGKIPVIVKKRKILESVESTEDGKMTGKARIKYDYENLTRNELLPFPTLDSAEAFVLSEGEIFGSTSTPPLNHVEPDSRFAHRITNGMANISYASNRGRGNTIVCHPSVTEQVKAGFDKLKTIQQHMPLDGDEENKHPDNWELTDMQIPYFPTEPEVIENEFAPDDAVLVLYRGTEDGDQPLIFIDGEGLLLNNKIAETYGYGKFVRIP